MGWGRGSQLAEEVWDIVRHHIPFHSRKHLAGMIIDAFEEYDADTMDEAEQLWKDSERRWIG
jgi:hypothetical protein